MKKLLVSIALVVVSFSNQAFAQCGTLVWSDEFNGTAVDNTKWVYETGGGGWGNGELQTYTNSTNNVRVENGHLVIEAINANGAITSGRLKTQGKYSRRYGRFETRAKLPAGTGFWPAFWMLSNNGNWPTTGEIDIMENRGDQTTAVAGTLHYGNPWPNNLHDGTAYNLSSGNFVDSYHIFAVEWEIGIIRWYVDGNLYKTETKTPNTLNPTSNNNAWPWDDSDFFMIVNLAIGGINTPYTGYQAPNIGTGGKFEVDYIRVYDSPQPQLNLAGKSQVFQNTTAQYSIPASANQNYTWTVPAGATIASGQSTNQITVNWGTSQGGDVRVDVQHLTGAACPGKTFFYTKTVSVSKNNCSFTFQNYDGQSTMSAGYVSGQLYTDNNPAINTTNPSAKVGRYVRNSTQQYDALFYDNALLDNGPQYANGTYQIKMDVYTGAASGTPIQLQLGNQAAWGGYPAGIHSVYAGATSAVNQWHTVTFTYSSSPDANGATYQNNLDRMVLLFNPNAFTGSTFYIDNIRREFVPTPGTLNINGPQAVALNQAGVGYTVSGGNLSNPYVWTTPVGSTISGVSTTNKINLNYGVIGGIVSVQEQMSSGCYGPVASKSISVGGNSCALFSDEFDKSSSLSWIKNTTSSGFGHTQSISDWIVNSPGYGEWEYFEYTLNDGTNPTLLDFTNPLNNPILKIKAKASGPALLRVTFVDNTGKVAGNQYLNPLNGLVLTSTSKEYSIDFNGQFWDQYNGGGVLDQSKIAKIRFSINPGFVSFPISTGGYYFNSAFVGTMNIDYVRIGNDCPTANANFSASDLIVCGTTSSITFTDGSSNTTSTTGYRWDFGAGATPATATTKGPFNVTYNTPGWKTVSLTVDGISMKTQANYVYVSPPSTGCVFQDDYADGVVNAYTAAQGNFTFTESNSQFHINTTGSGEWETFSQKFDALGATMPIDFSCGNAPTIKIRAKASSKVALRVNLQDSKNVYTNNAATVAQTMELTTTFQDFTLDFKKRFTDQYSSGGPFVVDSTNIVGMLFSLNPGFASFPWTGTVGGTYNTTFNGTVDIEYIYLGNCKTNPTFAFTSTNAGIFGNSISLNASSNSTGAISYSVANGSGTAVLVGNTLSLTGVGTVTVTGTQAATSSYNAISQAQIITIGKANASLSMTSTAAGIFGSNINLTSTANAPGTVVYTVANGTGSAAVVGNALNLTGVGTVTVTGTLPASANYTAATSSQVITIGKATPTLAITSASLGQAGTTIGLTATTNGVGAVTWSVISGNGSISGNNLSLINAGTVTIQASLASSANYTSATALRTITITALTVPTITYGSVTKTYGDAPFANAATSNSTGAMSYSIGSGNGLAMIHPATGAMTIAGAGVVTVRVDQVQSGTFAAAFQTATVVIAKKSLSATADGKTRAYNTANPAFTITYNGFVGTETASVLDVQPSIGTPSTQTSAAGLYPITVAGGLDNNYALTYISGTLTVTKIAPSLNITSANVGQTGTSIPLSASSNSTGAITWTIVSGNGTIAGNSVNLGAAGSVTVQANLAADVNYTSATAQQTISITTQSVPTIQFANSSKTYGDPVFTVTATSNSVGSMTYSIASGTAFAAIHPTLGTVTILGAGSVTLKVDQAANGTFAASSKTATLTIGQKALTATADGKTRGYNSPNPTFTLSYAGFVYGETANVIDVLPTAATSATQSSNAGTYAIVPSGGLDNNYSFAYANGTLTVTSIDPSLTITSTNSSQAGSTIGLTASSNSAGAISWSVVSGNGSVSGSTLTLISAGSVTVQANVAATTNYNAFSVQQIVTIGAQTTPTISFADVVKTFGDNAFSAAATSNSPGALTYSVISGNGLATIDPNTGMVTILGAGTVTLQVSQAASGTFAATTKTATLTINKATRTISITSPTIGAAGTQIALTANVSPTATVVWSVSNGTGSAAITGAMLDLINSGTITVQADVPADANYLAASASQTVTISPVTGVADAFSSSQVKWNIYPNPYDRIATISFELPEASVVSIKVYNALGMEIVALVKESILAQGTHSIGLEGLSSGTYLVKLTANGKTTLVRVVKE